MQLMSFDFADDAAIPVRCTCDGADEIPRLAIQDAPAGTQRFAVIVEDPDAPTANFTHWVAWNIPAATTELSADVLNICPQGRNDFGAIGYGGPCPPKGEHRYCFRLYALDCDLPLAHGASKDEVRAAMQGHILAESLLTGRYARQ